MRKQKQNQSQKLKRKILDVSFSVGACHIGSALSCADIIEEIFRKKRKKDIFIFGKASGFAAYLCFKYPLKQATELLKKYPLPAKEAGVPWSGGSVGTGLSVACGMALADRKRNIFCLLGDADIQEGQTYEALLFARQYKLENLKIYIDRNFMQAMGKTEEIIGIDKALEVLNHIFPIKVIKTLKGQGVPFIVEMGYKNHYYNLSQDGYTSALRSMAD